jgi:hypothetical protein
MQQQSLFDSIDVRLTPQIRVERLALPIVDMAALRRYKKKFNFFETVDRVADKMADLLGFGLGAVYQLGLALDAKVINDYCARRIRYSGSRGLLRLPEMQRKYPHINNQRWED